ncbi:acetate and sugar kinases/Hsc70/actin family protein [Mastigocladopsis repens]|uniref:hypothetical protein n=1 Tax=Mastigocladopsis repens TaxID=221287 RepID=UPI00035D8623|nr:hypothetical protein [Mastigocladopsis repens]
MTTDIKLLEVVENSESLELPQTVDKPAKKTRRAAVVQNKSVTVDLDLDAGSSRCKFVVNGWAGSYPSVFKEVSGELPSGISGCFSLGSKNYAAGRVTSSLNGTLTEAFRDNKVRFLHIWLLGALTNCPDLLSDIGESRKYKGKPARLKITLRLLSLSSSKKNDIAKTLQGIKTFTWEGTVFEIEIVNTDSCLYPEGYGSACLASAMLLQGSVSTQEFCVIDLGGGTLTFSTYQVGKKPRAVEQTPGSGNGIKAIIERLSIALSRTDRGGIQFKKENLESALQNSKPDEKGGHSVKYRHGQESLEIGDIVTHALSEWVAEMPIVESLLTKVSQALLNGTPVFACGGGFAVTVIADWLRAYVCADIENPQFLVLENPQNINLTGLRYLNPQSQKHWGDS